LLLSSKYSYPFCHWNKVCGLTLLLQVRTMWRCGDSLFFKVPPLASSTLLTTLHPLLENMLQTVDHFEISCLRAPFSWLEKPRNHMGWDMNWILCSAWNKQIGGTPLEHLPYSVALLMGQNKRISSVSSIRSEFNKNYFPDLKNISYISLVLLHL
jgi:hypothetical protein